MKIVGLDLSMTSTGIALVDGTTLTVRTNVKDGDRRLLVIRDAVEKLVPPADLAVIEGPGRFLGNTGHVIGMVHGVVRELLFELRIPYAMVAPASLKVYATGNKNADKAAMAVAALKRQGTDFTEPGRDHNQCDAAWLRWMGLDHCGEPEFSIPAVQRKSLDAVDWFAATEEWL